MTETQLADIKNAQQVKDVRTEYILAVLRQRVAELKVHTQSIHEIGVLLKNGHIDIDTALDMFEEVKALHFR